MVGRTPTWTGNLGAAAIVRAADGAWGAAIVSVAAAYYLIGGNAPSLALLAVLALLVWLRTDLAVALIPLALPLYMLPKHLHLVRTLDFSLGETAIVLCTAIALVQQLLATPASAPDVPPFRRYLPASPFWVPGLLFLAAASLSTIAAHYHTVAFRQYREVVLEPLLFYWLILQRLDGAVGARRLTLATVGAGTYVATLGALQIRFRAGDMAIADHIEGASKRLVAAVYPSENNLALLLDRAIPIALALAIVPGWWLLRGTLQARPAGAGAGGTTSLARSSTGATPPPLLGAGPVEAALLVASALMGYVLYRTDSRGGLLAIAACLAVLFVYWQRRRPAVLSLSGVVALLAALLARHKIGDTLRNGHGLASEARISIWQSALRMGRDHPLLGVGPDNFLYYYSNDEGCASGHMIPWYYRQANDAGKAVNYDRCISHPHNLFLDFWLSTGVLGLLAVLALLVLFAVLGIRLLQRAEAAWRGPLLAVLVAMLALVVHGQVDNSYFLPDLAALFWLCLGVVTLAWRDIQRAGSPTSS